MFSLAIRPRKVGVVASSIVSVEENIKVLSVVAKTGKASKVSMRDALQVLPSRSIIMRLKSRKSAFGLKIARKRTFLH